MRPTRSAVWSQDAKEALASDTAACQNDLCNEMVRTVRALPLTKEAPHRVAMPAFPCPVLRAFSYSLSRYGNL